MAYIYFGINLGTGEQTVTSNTSMLSTDVVIAYETTNVAAGKEAQLHDAVTAIFNAIQRGNFPA